MVAVMIASFWRLGANSPWSPNFDAKPLDAKIVGTETGPVADGAKIFFSKGCLNCHQIGEFGGKRGPNLTYVGEKLSHEQLVFCVSPTAASTCRPTPTASNPDEMSALVEFLQSRKR